MGILSLTQVVVAVCQDLPISCNAGPVKNHAMKSFPESLRTRLARSSRIKILVSKSKKSTKRIFKMSSVRGFCEVENIYQHIHKYDTYKSGISFPQSSIQPRNDKQQFSSNKNKKQINKQTQSNPTHVHIHKQNRTNTSHDSNDSSSLAFVLTSSPKV